VVEDMNPISNIEAITIDGNRLILQSIENDCGHELFRMLVWPIVIGAARNNNRQLIGAMISLSKKVGGSFAGRVRRIGAKRIVFGELLF
jgi:hypothetical protein